LYKQLTAAQIIGIIHQGRGRMSSFTTLAPPWGTLSAIDLNTGKYLWKVPLGEYPELAAKGLKNTGTENYSGPIVTAGGLLIIAATDFDRKIRAFNSHTGELLWEALLPFSLLQGDGNKIKAILQF
jgi:glucose dehydrogenase